MKSVAERTQPHGRLLQEFKRDAQARNPNHDYLLFALIQSMYAATRFPSGIL